MPRFNIYIRNDDLDAWNAIENKPAWIHANLMESSSMVEQRIVNPKVLGSSPSSPAKPDTIKQMATDDKDYKLCKHGAYPAFCKFSMPGKPCK